MLINPFTTIAQIINFFVLVLLLKKFLYRPILKAIDNREKRIYASLNEAKMEKENAKIEVENYRQKQQKWTEKKRRRWEEMEGEIAREKRILINNLEEEVSALRHKWYQDLKQEKQSFLVSFRDQAHQQVIKIARQALENLANVSLEQQIINKFLEGLPQIAEQESNKNKSSSNLEHQNLMIVSSFVIDSQQKQQLIQGLQQQFSQKIDVSFETNQQLICGLELLNNNYQVSWNLGQYLDELESKISQSLGDGEHGPER